MSAITGNTNAPKQDDYGGDEVSALVLDPGSSTTRAGFAGEDSPKSVINTSYGRTNKTSYIFGDESLHRSQPGMEILNPMAADGTVEDWDAATKLWEYSIRSRLTSRKQGNVRTNGLNNATTTEQNGDAMEIDQEADEEKETGLLFETPLLMTEPAWNTPKNRERAIQIAMEQWDCPAFWISKTGVLAAFATGKPSALVIDIGARSTSITAVHDGMHLRKASLRTPLAGDFISDQIRLQFEQARPPIAITPHYLVASKQAVEPGQPALATLRPFTAETEPHPSFRRFQENRVIHEFKESVVEVWNRGGKLSGNTNGISNDELAKEPVRSFEFPDGYNQSFGIEQYRPVEALFDHRAALTSDEIQAPTAEMTIPAVVNKAIASVDVDLRGALLSQIILTGASSLIRGAPDRIQTEISAQHTGPRVRVNAPGNISERKYASWIGGSIVASLGTFHQMWISKKEYEESGPSIVEKRCK